MNARKRILVADDEDVVRETLRDFLSLFGYEVEIAQDGYEALAKLELDIDLLLSDLMMPGIDGFELIRRIRDNPEHSDLPIIMITGRSSHTDRLRAVELGANDFIVKPFDQAELRVRIASQLRLKEAYDKLKHNQIELEAIVERRTSSLRKTLDEMVNTQRRLREAHLETIQRLVIAAEHKDKGTASHIRRMSRYCQLLARQLNLPPSDVELVVYASPMHDIGKIGTPEEILLKPTSLNDDEWILMRQHPQIGAKILHGSSSALLRAGEIIALTHHERWDGNGYPQGLAGEDIPLWGRISSIADVFDALTSERPYKKAFSNETALNVLQDGSDKHFDPQLVEVFMENMDEVVRIQNNDSA